MTRELHHQMMVANAGSGKTYCLTTRMVSLLARGVEPRAIAALTFTKKAAGEFLDAVFKRLADAALDPACLDALRRDTGVEQLDAAACRGILIRLVDQMGGLCMGTIDSLFGRIARAFPFESGLAGDFSILSDADMALAREDALAMLFRQGGESPEGFAELLDKVRQQSRRQSEQSVFTTLLDSVRNLHDTFLTTPQDVTWGDRNTIWPGGSPILSAPDPGAAAGALWQVIETTHPDLGSESREGWQSRLAEIAELKPGQAWSRELSDFITKKICGCSVDKAGREYVPIGRGNANRTYLDGPVAAARTTLLHALLRQEFEQLLRRSAALHFLIGRFEAYYDRTTRLRGLLTFGDVTSLLARQVEDPTWKSSAGYRLDNRYDHWLLDEFQDTSRTQWEVLRAFIDEVLQDTGGTRSLFYVGDAKQAIYLWRGGDPGLFFEIRDYYNQSKPDHIRSGELADSHRSTREIVEVVNAVFGDLTAHAETLGLPAAAVRDWTKAWRKHRVATRNESLEGYVRWVPVDKDGPEVEEEEDPASPQDLEILKILEEVRPWKRGLVCAVLKRDNKKVKALANLLQSKGVPVAVEGKSNPCTDNPLGAALLAAFRCAALPGDSLSSAMLAGYPLGAPLLRDADHFDPAPPGAGYSPLRGPVRKRRDLPCAPIGVRDGEYAFREAALRSIATVGFAATARRWIAAVPLDNEPFLAGRGAAFLSAATAFDADPSGGILRFLDVIENHSVQDAESADVVRVMTIHQAKGLTFDMVVVSGLETLVKDRTAGAMSLGGGRPPTWGMELPKKEFAAQDSKLKAAGEALIAADAYGELCAAYVAITRPRLGLYLVTNQLGENTSAKNFARLLMLTLDKPGPVFEAGNPQWFETKPVREPAAPPSGTVQWELPPPHSDTPRPIPPSAFNPPGEGENTESEPPILRHSPEATRLGLEVHAALARIEWSDGSALQFHGVSEDAAAILNSFLAGPTAQSLFKRPTHPCLLWRERSFDVIVDGQWMSGVFDRVHIQLDDTGHPVSATIHDFKTDRTDAAEIQSRHAGQMSAYRRAAALLLGLDETAVTSQTVPVRG